MRAAFADAARARTLREFAVVRDVPFVVVRDVTPRDATAAGAVPVVPRDTVLRDVTAREEFTTLPDAAVPRDTVAVVVAELPRGLVRALRTFDVARGDCDAAAVGTTGATGSANTARIDSNVEQTKKAPANKNTVPTAFLQKSATLRLFINTLH